MKLSLVTLFKSFEESPPIKGMSIILKLVMVESKKKFSYEEAGEVVRNKPGFHNLMLRNGWHVPSIHSEICSLKWMRAVRKQKIYCPRRSERNGEKHCWSPPPLKDLL